MPEELQQEIGKLIVTSRGLEPPRYLRFALRNAVRGARVRSAGFRRVFTLEAGDVSEHARVVCRECVQSIGHVTAVLATVESRDQAVREAAVRIGRERIGPEESFCFRLHKRGNHGLEHDSLTLEQAIGGAIWVALEEKYKKSPKVSLKNPDIKIVAEILGPMAAVGVSRKAWSSL